MTQIRPAGLSNFTKSIAVKFATFLVFGFYRLVKFLGKVRKTARLVKFNSNFTYIFKID